jgi:hypothetical protein
VVEVEVWPRRDGRWSYTATFTYSWPGIAVDRSLTGRHPLTGDEHSWHLAYGRAVREARGRGHVEAARQATQVVFGVDPTCGVVGS